MKVFINLIINELLKIFMQKIILFMYFFLALLTIIIMFLNQATYTTSIVTEDNWERELREQNSQLIEDIRTYKSNDKNTNDFLLNYNLNIINKNNFHLSHKVMPREYDTWRYILDNADILSFVTLMTIVVAAGIMSNEYKWGTINLLLIRPVTRLEILLTKFISTLLFALLAAITVIILSLIVGSVFLGFNALNYEIIIEVGTGFKSAWIISEIFKTYLSGLANLCVMATFAFTISVLFRNSSIAIGLAVFLMLSGNTIVGVFADKEWSKYILFANTDLKAIIEGKSLINELTIQFSLMMLGFYFILFLLLTIVIFTKRDIHTK